MNQAEKLMAISLTITAEYGKSLDAVMQWVMTKTPQEITLLARHFEHSEHFDELLPLSYYVKLTR